MIPLASEEINNLVRKGAMLVNTLATILCDMSSFPPLAWHLKGDTARITSSSDTMVNLNPSNGAVTRMSSDADGSSVEEIREVVIWFIRHEAVTGFGN